MQNRAVTGSIVIVSALAAELAALRSALTSTWQIQLGPAAQAWRGHLDGRPVVLAEAGIGKVAMATVATVLIKQIEPVENFLKKPEYTQLRNLVLSPFSTE